MSKSLKDAERKVFRLATFNDGLWDLFLGLYLILMSAYPLTRSLFGPALNGIFILAGCGLLLIGVWLVKKHIVQPRAGMIQFGTRTKRRIKKAQILTWGLVLATCVTWLLGAKNLFPEPTWEKLPQWVSDFDVDFIFALIIVACFSLAASAIGVRRLHLYGILFGFGSFISTVLLVYQDLKFQYPLLVAGLIVVAMGTIVLMRFLRDYPLHYKVA
jgi:hypothetical protein